MYRCLSSASAPVSSHQSPAQALLRLRLNSLSITRDSRFNEFVKLSTFAAVSPGDCFVFSLSLTLALSPLFSVPVSASFWVWFPFLFFCALVFCCVYLRAQATTKFSTVVDFSHSHSRFRFDSYNFGAPFRFPFAVSVAAPTHARTCAICPTDTTPGASRSTYKNV